MINAKGDMHRDESRVSGFQEALQRLREHAFAGHFQLLAERPSAVQFSKGRAVSSLRAR